MPGLGAWRIAVLLPMSEALESLGGLEPLGAPPTPRAWRAERAFHGEALARDLRHLVHGAVDVSDAALTAASADYGALVTRRPAVIVRPREAEDVAAVMRFATPRRIPVAARGAGHSQGGQPLCEGGVLLDMRALAGVLHIDGDRGFAEAHAGTSWRSLASAALARGLTPPVLTSNLDTTLGGTHALGGFGVTSLRAGAQVDHCLGLELVTGAGQVIWCASGEHETELEHTLGGLGQLGIITRVRHRLRRCRAYVTKHLLAYRDIATMLADLNRLVDDSDVEALGASIVRPRGRWVAALLASAETDDPKVDRVAAATASLQPDWRAAARVQSRRETGLGIEGVRDRRRAAQRTVRPCLDMLLPAPSAAAYCAAALRALPSAMADQTQIVVLPVDRRTSVPSLVGGVAHATALVGIYGAAPAVAAGAAVDALRRLAALALTLGGAHYPAGSLPLDAAAWRAHLGDRWPWWLTLKQSHDPAGILRGGLEAAP